MRYGLRPLPHRPNPDDEDQPEGSHAVAGPSTRKAPATGKRSRTADGAMKPPPSTRPCTVRTRARAAGTIATTPYPMFTPRYIPGYTPPTPQTARATLPLSRFSMAASMPGSLPDCPVLLPSLADRPPTPRTSGQGTADTPDLTRSLDRTASGPASAGPATPPASPSPTPMGPPPTPRAVRLKRRQLKKETDQVKYTGIEKSDTALTPGWDHFIRRLRVPTPRRDAAYYEYVEMQAEEAARSSDAYAAAFAAQLASNRERILRWREAVVPGKPEGKWGALVTSTRVFGTQCGIA